MTICVDVPRTLREAREALIALLKEMENSREGRNL
jgi:hypothetical protein